MIILWRQIYHTIHNLIAPLLRWVYDPLNHGYPLFLILLSLVRLVPEEKFIKSIIMSLDAIDCAIEWVDLPITQYPAVTWRAHSSFIWDGVDLASIAFQLTSEKLIECAEIVEVFDQDFVKLDSVEFTIREVEITSKIGWQRHAAEIPCKSAQPARRWHFVFDFILAPGVQESGERIRTQREAKPLSRIRDASEWFLIDLLKFPLALKRVYQILYALFQGWNSWRFWGGH